MLWDSKLKTMSVGGLARPDGKILHGFRGCIQVCPFLDPIHVWFVICYVREASRHMAYLKHSQ